MHAGHFGAVADEHVVTQKHSSRQHRISDQRSVADHDAVAHQHSQTINLLVFRDQISARGEVMFENNSLDQLCLTGDLRLRHRRAGNR